MRSVKSIPASATGSRATTPAFTEASPGRAEALPAIADSGPVRRFAFGAALVGGYGMLAIVSVRLVVQGILGWWMPLAALMGVAAADLVSGIVHWAADTWGRDDLPVIGPGLLVPFRVHHVNPDDFRRRRFVDVNGDVALIAVPALLGLLAVDVESSSGAAACAFGAAFCAASMLTNQIHQWAHMPAAPRAVRVLQACGLILQPSAHAAHHARPYEERYCITTGWWNRPLDAIGFFRSLERMITRATGVQARRDDRQYEQRYAPLMQVEP
jgi:ubiquitin-conjugating enzyme E2 variant